MKRALKLTTLFCLLSATQLSLATQASDGYVYDPRDVVVRDGFGGCVKTTRWSPAIAIAGCDSGQAAAASAPARAADAVVAKPAAAAKSQHVPVVISLSADESFDVNKAELKPAAKIKLKQFVQDIKTYSYEKIVVTGHADHTGNKAANQQLSERRANTVHNFLISEGVASGNMSSTGVGSNQPVTQPGDCAKLKGKPLQACLAPDRRVNISVLGVKAK